MTGSRRRVVRGGLFVLAWAVAVGLGLWVGLTAFDTNSDHWVGLLGLAYLAAWVPIFALSSLRPSGKIAAFALCSVSLAVALALPRG